MANTKKKTDELDYTNQPQATTQEDVNNQDAKTRLWQSLAYSYGDQLKQSNKSYDQAYSQADRQALSKGMQRSTQNLQTLANINQQRIEANNNINAALIADYQRQIGTLEAQEKEDDRWERQFAETQKQNEWNRTFQEKQADQSQMNWLKEYEANRADTSWSQNYQTEAFNYSKEKDALDNAYRQEQFDFAKAQDARDALFRQAQFDYSKEQDALNREEREGQTEYAKEQDALNNAFRQEQFDYSKEQDALNRGFQEQQFAAQVEQWREEFDYKKMSTDQQMAFEVLTRALAAGNDADDDTLKRAGISRAEYNSMKAQTAQNGGAGSVTWRQTEDAKAKSLGFTGRNDPNYIAYMNGGATTGGTTPAQDDYAEFYNAIFGTETTTGKEPVAYGTTAFNFKQPVYEGSITVGGKTYSIDEYNKLKAKASK